MRSAIDLQESKSHAGAPRCLHKCHAVLPTTTDLAVQVLDRKTWQMPFGESLQERWRSLAGQEHLRRPAAGEVLRVSRSPSVPWTPMLLLAWRRNLPEVAHVQGNAWTVVGQGQMCCRGRMLYEH